MAISRSRFEYGVEEAVWNSGVVEREGQTMYSHDYTTLQCYVLQLLQYYSINAFNNHQQQRNQPLFEHAFQYPWRELKISLVHVWYQNHFPVYASMAPHFQDKLCTAQGMCFYKMFNQLT